MSEFKNLPSGWKVVKLGDVLKIGSGRDYKHLELGNIPVYGTGGYMLSVDEFLYDGESVCIGRKGTIDKPIYLNCKFWTVDTLFYTYGFKNSLPKFIYYIFSTIDWQKYNEATGVPSLSKNTICNIRVKLPSLDEQEKVAEILSTWDEAINLTINLIESKKQFKKALMQNLLTAKIRFPEFQDEWREVRLGKILKERKTYQNKGFDLEHVSLTKDGVVPKSERYDRDFLVKDDNKQYKITKLNDICYNPANLKFGVICKNTYGNGIFSPIYVTFECCNELDNNFAGFCLTQNDFIQKVRKFEEGTVYERMAVSSYDFLRFKIKLPNLNEQQKIAEVLTACDDEINLLNLKLENLKKQKQGLMQKLLSGKVRVKGGKNVKMGD